MFTSNRKSGRLFFDLSMKEKRAKRTRDHCAQTFPGDRSVQEECAKRIPTALAHLSLPADFSFSHRDNPTSRQHDAYDQDSSISFDDDEHSTASQEDDLEHWIENIEKSTTEADENTDV